MSARGWAIVGMLASGAALVLLDWPATLTDEDDYMPRALEDALAGRNPYATEHGGSGVVSRPWGDQPYAWTTTLPYLPALVLLQAPGVDYRWTALAAYGALLLGLRASRWGFWAFANPLAAWLAASGFNDFVGLALLAWALRAPRGWPAWLAAACKQLVLPMLVADALVRRSWRLVVPSALFLAAAVAPFLVWDAEAFVASTLLAHVDKAPVAYGYWNYWLYPLFFATAMLPDAMRERAVDRARRDAAAQARKA